MATADRTRISDRTNEFEACVADYREAMAELREIERRMTGCVKAMRTAGAPRERLLAASVIVGDVRHALQVSRFSADTETGLRRAA